VGHSDLVFNMIVLPLPCLLCFISIFGFVAPSTFQLEHGDVYLEKSEDDQYSLRVQSSMNSNLDSWHTLTKLDISAEDILSPEELQYLSSSDEINPEVFSDSDKTSLVIISFNQKTKTYSIKGMLDNEWVISPVDFNWIRDMSPQKIWSSPYECDICQPVGLHSLKHIDTEGSEYKQLSDEEKFNGDPQALFGFNFEFPLAVSRILITKFVLFIIFMNKHNN